MKTVLVTNGNLSSLLALSGFLKVYGSSISAIFITTKLPSQKNNVVGIYKMLRLSGLSYTYFKLFTNIILPKKISIKGFPFSVVTYMKSLGYNIPVIHTSDINSEENLNKIRSFNPEILLSFSSTMRFSNQLVSIPIRAAVNAHYALLPEYAGLSPYFWYLKNQEAECGVTLHQISSLLDAGPVIEQDIFSLSGFNSVLAVLIRQAKLVSPLLIRYYRGETHENNSYLQDLSRRSYFKHPNRIDMKEFNERGFVFFKNDDISRVVESMRVLANDKE